MYLIVHHPTVPASLRARALRAALAGIPRPMPFVSPFLVSERERAAGAPERELGAPAVECCGCMTGPGDFASGAAIGGGVMAGAPPPPMAPEPPPPRVWTEDDLDQRQLERRIEALELQVDTLEASLARRNAQERGEVLLGAPDVALRAAHEGVELAADRAFTAVLGLLTSAWRARRVERRHELERRYRAARR